MEKAIECFDWDGCFILANIDEIIYYEIIIDKTDKKNIKFLPIQDGVFKFTFKFGFDEYGGLYPYKKEIINFETIQNEIINVYNNY